MSGQKFWACFHDVLRNPSVERYVDHLIVEVLCLAHIELAPHIVVYTGGELELTMAKEKCYAKPDVFVVDRKHNYTYLLVHENDRDHPFPQVVAEAIAAFQNEQYSRARSRRPRLTHFPILLGVCHGTVITFMRAIIPWSVAKAVKVGNKLEEDSLEVKLEILKFPTEGLDFSFKTHFDQIMSCLACVRHIIHRGAEKIKVYEKVEEQ